ncbi:MAG TPA: glycine--tRNA ligase subunit beta [Steroidobacteraceae bacterium]|nr:glycine--tRNA ligase subunit beta [Steroidobacteraceae bacterium]
MSVERSDFLVELGTEELPPTALRGLEQAFASGIRFGLEKAGLAHGEIRSFATPRRLAVLVKRLAERQPDQDIKRRGPPLTAAFDGAGQPTRAASAFAASCGVPVDQLQKLEEGKGSFLFFIATKPGALVQELIPQIVLASLDALPIPRRMRWGSGSAEFVRPVHWLLMLYGKEVIPATLLETTSGNQTRGHRFHAPKPLRITTPGAYERALERRGYVRAAFGARRDLIAARVSELATELGGRAVISEDLLEEVTALVEWPVPFTGRFEERFLSLPREVLISTLQDHQRYFPVEDAQGRLLPNFIAVSNIESRDPAKVREGNERVVRPRLADAAFFFEQDRKQPLAARRAGLDTVTYQVKLGSLGDKTRRVSELAIDIATALAGDRARAGRAGELCKCDLLTAMVGEFPDLQGIMGTYYARADGEDAEVATAIHEHYLPRGAGDGLPQTPTGLAVALADKLDTLAGIFAINEKPTGTKDPFGLRRAAIGILRILIEKELDLDLRHFIGSALERVRADILRLRGDAPAGADTTGKPAVPTGTHAGASQVYDFIMERLRAYYLESAAPPGTGTAVPLTGEMFDAVLATRPVSPLDFDARLKALSVFLTLPEASALAAANKRTANILRKSGTAASGQIDVEHLRDPAEVRLFDAMRSLQESVTGAVARREYTRALGTLAQLRPAVDAFFEHVLVMDEDPRLRANRLALLAQLHGLFGGIADLSRLPG